LALNCEHLGKEVINLNKKEYFYDDDEKNIHKMQHERLNKHSSIPLYIQLEDIFRERVRSNIWNRKMKIPPEHIIMKEFNVSRQTVQKAIDGLAVEGLLKRTRGRGTEVIGTKIKQEFFSKYGFSSYFMSKNMKPSSKLLYFDIIPATELLTQKLKIKEKEKLLKITRLRLIDNEPIMICSDYIIERLVPSLKPQDFLNSSLNEYLISQYNLDFCYEECNVELTFPNSNQANLLEISRRTPCMLTEGISHNKQGKILRYWKVISKGSRYKISFKVEVTR